MTILVMAACGRRKPAHVQWEPGNDPAPATLQPVIAAMQAKINSDPRITVKEARVGYDSSGAGKFIHLSGRVGSEDEVDAALNDVRSLLPADGGLGIGSSLGALSSPTAYLAPDPLLDSTQRLDTVPRSSGQGPSGAASVASGPVLIPLCPGLTVVTAISQAGSGDYESIKTIESLDAEKVGIKYSAEIMSPVWSYRGLHWGLDAPGLKKLSRHRDVLVSALDTASTYDPFFTADESAEASATAIGTSTGVLQDLKTIGESGFEFRRVGTRPIHVRVLVNDTLADLPVIAATRHDRGGRSEFLFLDDEHNPVTLGMRLHIGGTAALTPHERQMCERARTTTHDLEFGGEGAPSCDLPDGGDEAVLRVIKITTRCTDQPVGAGGPGNGAGVGGSAAADAKWMEQQLATQGKVDVYSIYFSFASDSIREESERTLKTIATVLARHPEWKISVAGHTDAVGDDASNLDLSRRRAAAVQLALTERYGVKPLRLSTTGYGRAQPVASNETMQGRARNRRVELALIR